MPMLSDDYADRHKRACPEHSQVLRNIAVGRCNGPIQANATCGDRSSTVK